MPSTSRKLVLQLIVAAMIGLVPTAVTQIEMRAWPKGNTPAAYDLLSKWVYHFGWPGDRIGEGIVGQLDVFGLSQYSKDHKVDKYGTRADFKSIYPLQVACIAIVDVVALVGFWFAMKTGGKNSRRRKIAVVVLGLYVVVVGLGLLGSLMFGYL